MTPQWLAMLSCLALAALAHGAAVPTTATLVVTTETNDQTQNTISIEDFTTSSPPPPIKLTSMDVRSEVRMRYAHTAVVAHVRNPASVAQEAAFRMLLPEAAFISGFTMVLNDKSYEASVKEKEEAKQTFNDAVSSGSAAAHITTKARNSNHFTVSVNVEPNTTAEFRLTYEELLPRRNGVYNHAVNLHPGELVPSLTVTVHIKESQKITALRVPEIRTGNEIDATEADPQNTKAVIERSEDGREATITFRPDLEEQRSLRNVYAMKTRPGQSADGVLGQFVVQYDVERTDRGEVLVNDGYFVHFFAPSTLQPLSKHVVFVLDTSGSMEDGRKLVQLQEAMDTILSDLNHGDYFTLMSFETSVTVHNLDDATTGTPKAYPATPEYIRKAKKAVHDLVAVGGTQICLALEEAIGIIQRGVEGTTTDSINTLEMKNLEPTIIFLTDGNPDWSAYIMDKNVIDDRVSEKNAGPRKASIYALAFGEDADREFLRKLSLRNDGVMRHIYEAADAALQLRDFYRQVASPLLANVHFVYPKEQIEQDSVTKQVFRTLYAGSEAVVAGRYQGEDFSPLVYGERGVRTVDDRERYEVSSPVSHGSEQSLPLERLWAYLTVQQLLDASVVADEKAGAAKKALDIALKYSFVTPLTSLVVVKPNATNAVNAESVDMTTTQAPITTTKRSLTASAGGRGSGGRGWGYRSAHDNRQNYNPYRRNSGWNPRQHITNRLNYGSYEKYSTRYSNHHGYKSRDNTNLDYDSDRGNSGWNPNHHGYKSRDNTNLDNGSYRGNSGRYSDHYGMVPRGSWYSTKYTPNRLKSYASHYNHTRHISRKQRLHDESSPPSTPPPSPLAPYRLENCPWVQQLMSNDSDTIVIPVDGTRLTLIKDSKAPVESGGDTECARATPSAAGAGGVCVYLTRCVAARAATAADYANTFCAINKKYAGICCPDGLVIMASGVIVN